MNFEITEDLKIATGKEIAEETNKMMHYTATLNDIDKQQEDDGKAETHRTSFRRERDRILYSGGFRRLQDKTQVMAAVKTGDHRTRLTHSLEVEQIAISIADALRLNKDLTSAIALGHDIGHTPFGHAVERFLDKKLKDKGGFSHALESVRYLKKNDIDVSEEIIEGILKHDTDVFVHKFVENGQLDSEDFYYINEPPGTLEAQIVYWADKIAYITHDYEDFIKSDLLQKAIDNNQIVKDELEELLSELLDCEFKLTEYKTRDLTRDLVRNITKNLIKNSQININECFKNVNLTRYNKKSKQRDIRKRTTERIENCYNEKEEYKFLKGLQLDSIINEEEYAKLEKIGKFYEEKKDDKMVKEIKQLKLDIDEKISLENEIESMSNIKILKEQKRMNRYKELSSMKVDIVEKRMNKIKKESYQARLIINLSDEYRERYLKLRDIIDNYYIGSPEIQLSDAKAERIVSSLFDMYCNNIKILPNEIKDKIKKDIRPGNNGTENKEIELRNIASYIASMSDRYAEQIYMDLNSTGSHYGY